MDEVKRIKTRYGSIHNSTIAVNRHDAVDPFNFETIFSVKIYRSPYNQPDQLDKTSCNGKDGVIRTHVGAILPDCMIGLFILSDWGESK